MYFTNNNNNIVYVYNSNHFWFHTVRSKYLNWNGLVCSTIIVEIVGTLDAITKYIYHFARFVTGNYFTFKLHWAATITASTYIRLELGICTLNRFIRFKFLESIITLLLTFIYCSCFSYSNAAMLRGLDRIRHVNFEMMSYTAADK